ncbi:MAG: TrmH family RNA methyltransferase [Thermoprotei archaeon]|nr:TrmH family RNA methyltransferase [Thermoprotei archaeon]
MDKLRLILVGVEGAVNMGMIARLAENFSVDEFYLVSPVASIDEALEYAARAADRLLGARIVSSLDEALEGVSLSICTSASASGEDVLRIPVKPHEAAELAASVKGTVALVMGRESVGLTRLEISKCTLLATIEASPKYPELNLSNATAIMLYELFKVRGKPHYAEEPADPNLIWLIEAYARSLAELLIADKRRVEEVALAFRRVAAKNIVHRKEAENIVLILSKACRRLGECRIETPAQTRESS